MLRPSSPRIGGRRAGCDPGAVTSTPPRLLSDAAFEDIKRRVLRCELAPGERVSEPGMVALTGFSKTPVREALGRLAREGLVRPLPRQGYRVAPLTLRAVEDMFDMWRILGPAAAERAAGRLTPAARARMQAVVDVGGYVATDEESVDAWLSASHDYQVAIAESTGNARLVAAVSRLDEDFARVFRIAFVFHDLGPQVHRVFADLLAALEAGDARRARAVAARAIDRAYEDTLAVLRSRPEVLETPLLPS